METLNEAVNETTEQSAVQDNLDFKLESLTIADCGPLYERIKATLGQGESIVLELGQCEEVDTAGLQLLVAIQSDPEVNLKVHWTKPSEAIAMKAERLGLSSWINAGSVEV